MYSTQIFSNIAQFNRVKTVDSYASGADIAATQLIRTFTVPGAVNRAIMFIMFSKQGYLVEVDSISGEGIKSIEKLFGADDLKVGGTYHMPYLYYCELVPGKTVTVRSKPFNYNNLLSSDIRLIY